VECWLSDDVVVGREKEYGNSFSIPVKEWGKSTVDCLDIVADASKSLRSWWNQEDVEGSDVLLIRRLDRKRLLEGRTRSRLARTAESERCVFTGVLLVLI